MTATVTTACVVTTSVTDGHTGDATERPISGDLDDCDEPEHTDEPKNACDASQIGHTAMFERPDVPQEDDLSVLGSQDDDLWRWRSVGGGRFARMRGSGEQRVTLKIKGENGENLTYVRLEDLSDERQQQYHHERAEQGRQREALGRGWKSG